MEWYKPPRGGALRMRGLRTTVLKIFYCKIEQQSCPKKITSHYFIFHPFYLSYTFLSLSLKLPFTLTLPNVFVIGCLTFLQEPLSQNDHSTHTWGLNKMQLLVSHHCPTRNEVTINYYLKWQPATMPASKIKVFFFFFFFFFFFKGWPNWSFIFPNDQNIQYNLY